VSLTQSRIRALNAVVDEGSYTGAAKRLKMTQPAVSQAVQDLERTFGVALFERRGRHLIPTNLCLELAPLAKEMASLETEALSILKRQEGLLDGVLRVSIGNLQPGMNIVAAFQKQFPGIQVEVEYTVFAEVLDAVLEGRADVGILPNVPDDGRFDKQACLDQRIVALIPTRHPLANASSISLIELVGERLIFQQKGSVTQRILDQRLRQSPYDLKPSLVLKTHSEVYEAVTSGLGIGFIWSDGTNRRDGARRIPILELDKSYPEELFRRADRTTKAIEMFFSSAKHRV